MSFHFAVRPGWIEPSIAEDLTKAGKSTQESREKLMRMAADLPLEFPAKVTGYAFDSISGLGVCAWTEQWYNASMARIDKVGGISGTTAWMPAFPVGGGQMPPSGGFPVEVLMRRRGIRQVGGVNRDPVFEFDWFCACDAQSGSGSGSGGGGPIITACCPSDGIPQTLGATLVGNSTCGTASFGLTYIGNFGGSDVWSGSGSTATAGTLTLTVTCSGAGTWSTTLTGTRCTYTMSGASGICSPFSVTDTATGSTACCVGAAVPVTWAITVVV